MSKRLWPSISSREGVDEDVFEFEKPITLFPVEKQTDQHIVSSVVYAPDEVDSQGDEANAEEIEKAAYYFMEHVQVFKTMHKGKPIKASVLESYLSPIDFTLGTQQIKKGSWIMTLRINDSKVWKLIKSGKLKGFSMAGKARKE